jgi:nicotinate phosphoribosyltransferase
MTSPPPELRRGILSTDAYQLTMAQLYLRHGLHERDVRFEHFFRSYPDYGTHQAGYCVAAGLAPFADWMTSVRARPADVEALRGHRSRCGDRLFDDSFCDWFATIDFSGLRLDAVLEGRVVHPNTPITVVEGPLGPAQLLETPLLNRLNFETLIATKAARVLEAAQGRPVLEFGMRRAAAEGADAASRAAIVGGAASTSNAAVGYELGRPPAGTHAHSMVQLFIALGGGEQAAFDAYADVYPDDCLLLVDTVDTLGSGIPNAIATFERLRRDGHAPVGIRLDSGDLAYLAVQAARELDRAGFPDTTIVLSSQLDELTVWQIFAQIALEARRAGIDADAVIARLVLGVGSRLATSHGDPSLDGVYKLVAVRGGGGGAGGAWLPAIKRSDSPAKVLNPGVKRLWRLYDDRGQATADVMSTAAETLESGAALTLHHHARPEVSRTLAAAEWTRAEELTVAVVDGGAVTVPGGAAELADLEAAAARRRADIDALDPGVRRLVNPHTYHVSITPAVFDEKRRLLDALH